MYIAVDNQVSDSAIDFLEEKGMKIVLRARHEPDNMWFMDALDLGAEVFVSPDWDISFLCNAHNVKFIKLKQGLRGLAIGRFILECIEKKRYS